MQKKDFILELSVLKKKVKDIESKNIFFEKSLNTQRSKHLWQIKKIINYLSKKKSIKHFIELEEMVSANHQKINIGILKTNIMSEVSRIYPGIFPKILVALDNNDDWFFDRKNYTIHEWKTEIELFFDKNFPSISR